MATDFTESTLSSEAAKQGWDVQSKTAGAEDASSTCMLHWGCAIFLLVLS